METISRSSPRRMSRVSSDKDVRAEEFNSSNRGFVDHHAERCTGPKKSCAHMLEAFSVHLGDMPLRRKARHWRQLLIASPSVQDHYWDCTRLKACAAEAREMRN